MSVCAPGSFAISWSSPPAKHLRASAFPPANQQQLLLPDGYSEIVFKLDAAFERWAIGHPDERAVMSSSYLIGGRSHSVLTRNLGAVRLAGAKLDSRLLRAIIGMPLSEFRDSSAVGGGMALAILPGMPDAASDAAKRSELTPWIVIGADDTVTIRVPGPEAGTGGTTQVCMLVAEELQCDWAQVRAEPISYNRNTREGNLYIGQTGTWSTFAGGGHEPEIIATMLQVGASARERLRAAAASRWNVPVNEIEARAGLLTHTPTSRQARFGEMAAAAATIQLAKEPAPKPQSEWTLLRKLNPPRLHVKSVVDGSSVYGIDVRLPGMLYAALVQCPVHGGKLKRFDFEAIRHMPGVRGIAVVDPSEPRIELEKPAFWAHTTAQSGIAVVAEHYWQARKALEALPLEWDLGSGVEWKDTEQIYESAYARALKIALSHLPSATFIFSCGPMTIERSVSRAEFESWIRAELDAMGASVDRLIAATGVRSDEIDRVFLTGGSALVPAVRRLFEKRFGAGKIAGGSEFTSVASGLALRALEVHGEGGGS